MKTRMFITVLCALVASPAFGDLATPGHGAGDPGGTAYYTRVTGYYEGFGGEITLEGSGLLLSNSEYASVAKGVLSGSGQQTTRSFQTFCMEFAEPFYEPMEVWVSQASTSALSTYGSGSHAYEGGVAAVGDNLDSRTAYLYTQFALGTLSNYSYNDLTNAAGSRRWDAEQLQKAIWHIEGESGGSNTGQAGLWIAEAQAAIDAGSWSGIGSVRALQMYRRMVSPAGVVSYQLRQDMLYVVPVPAAVLLGMLGLSVAGIKLRKHA